MKNAKTRMKDLDMMLRSSKWILEKKLKREDIAPSVARFCSGLPIYRLKKINDDDRVVVSGNGKKYVNLFFYLFMRVDIF